MCSVHGFEALWHPVALGYAWMLGNGITKTLWLLWRLGYASTPWRRLKNHGSV